jgi:hypothetical protein
MSFKWPRAARSLQQMQSCDFTTRDAAGLCTDGACFLNLSFVDFENPISHAIGRTVRLNGSPRNSRFVDILAQPP